MEVSDLVYRLTGGASNTDPNAALGGAMSTVAGGVMTSSSLNNLFDDASGDEVEDGDTEYRCYCIENTHASETLQAAVLWLTTASLSSDSEYAIGLDPAGINGTPTTIANEGTAPTGVTFSRPLTEGTALTVGDLDPDDFFSIWIRRVISANASFSGSDGPTTRLKGTPVGP